MSGNVSADKDETVGISKTGRMFLRKNGSLSTLPKIKPLRALFTAAQDTAFGVSDLSWEGIRTHYLVKYSVTHPEAAPEDFHPGV